MVKIIACILIAASLFSCTEEIITIKEMLRVDTVETVRVDTIETVRVDTVETLVEKVVVQTDTVYLDSMIYVVRDSIIFVHDTVVQIKTDTIYITQYYIYPYYQMFVDMFYVEAKAYGWGDLPKNNLVLTRWEIADIQTNGYPPWYKGEGVSIAYKDGHQWHAKINEIMRQDRWFIPIYRELGHVLLGKPYTDDPDDMMNPMFDPRQFTEREYDEPIARPYLDKLFAK